MKKYILTILFMFITTLPAFGRQYEFIREHSKIGFNIDYMMMSDVDGRFKVFHGDFDFNEKTKELSNIKVEINSESVDSNDEKRDFHLRGQEFLFSEVHRYITFTSKGVIKIKPDNTFEAPGVMSLRGISKPVTFHGVYKGSGKDAWGKDNHFFTLKGEINRKDYKMTWNKKLDNGGYLVGDVIRINIVLQTQFIGDKTPFSTHMIPDTKGLQERELLKKGKIKKLSTSTDPKDHTTTSGNQ
jgi:polyisoprenoid-binding protein YceI